MRLFSFLLLAACAFAGGPKSRLLLPASQVQQWADAPAKFAEGCSAVPATLNSVIDGTLSSTDCQLRDFFPASSLPFPAKAFKINVETPAVVRVQMSSTQIDSRVYVLNSTPVSIGFDDNSGGSRNASLSINLPAGTYTVLAVSPTVQGGEFRLSLGTEPIRTCSVAVLASGVEVEGTLGDPDCRYLDLRSTSSDTSFVDQYSVEVTKRSVISASMTSSAFDVYVEVLDASGQIIGWSDVGNLLVGVAPGKYTIRASSLSASAGAYKLKASIEDPRPCALKPVNLGSNVTGEFSNTDCRIVDLFTDTDYGQYVHAYRLELSQPSAITIAMSSPLLDTALELYTSRMELVKFNDDRSSETTDSRIYMSLKPGVYFILATQIEVATGAYEFSVASESLRNCNTPELGIPGAASGTLATGGCRFMDVVVPSDLEDPVQPYKLRVPRRSVLTVDTTSVAMDPLLVLLDKENRIVNYDDDGAGGTDSRLDILLDAGEYSGVVLSADGTLGAYNISTVIRDTKPCRVDPLGTNETLKASLAATDCRLREVLAGSTVNSRADSYKLVVPDGVTATVEVTTDAFPPILFVFDLNNQPVGLDVNNPAAPRSKASVTITKAGEYTVISGSPLERTGDYEVKVTSSPVEPK